MAGRLYVDANVFIAMLEQKDEKAKLLSRLLSVFGAHGVPIFVTSELSLAELLVVPLRMGHHELISVYRDWLGPAGSVSAVPVSRSILEMAARLRAALPSLRLPDAIHLATAVGADCSRFMTFDKKLTGFRFDFESEGSGRVGNPQFPQIDVPGLQSLIAEFSPA